MHFGGATPPHRDACEEVVLCVSGCGELHFDGAVRSFAAGQAIALPPGFDHRIVNAVADAPLETIAAFAAAPVPVALPDGSALPLPWQA